MRRIEKALFALLIACLPYFTLFSSSELRGLLGGLTHSVYNPGAHQEPSLGPSQGGCGSACCPNQLAAVPRPQESLLLSKPHRPLCSPSLSPELLPEPSPWLPCLPSCRCRANRTFCEGPWSLDEMVR